MVAAKPADAGTVRGMQFALLEQATRSKAGKANKDNEEEMSAPLPDKQEQQPTPRLPAWITELEDAHREALQKAQEAHRKGDDFQSGYHSGRAQVLQSWIESAKVGRV